MSDTLTITIDGKECTCEKGEYLYDVAKRNGIFIPVLCRSDAFDDHRACCRVCIVEVEERRGRTARQSYQYVDVLTGTVELFDIETGERLFDFVEPAAE